MTLVRPHLLSRVDSKYTKAVNGRYEHGKSHKAAARLWSSLSSPGRPHSLEVTAPTQLPPPLEVGVVTPPAPALSKQRDQRIEVDVYSLQTLDVGKLDKCEASQRRNGGRIFDSVTRLAGNKITFICTVVLLLIWAILGIVFRAPQEWQILMQDIGSIQCYISDTLLMRQQQNQFKEVLTFCGALRSRNATCLRLLRHISSEQREALLNVNDGFFQRACTSSDANLPTEGIFDRICDGVSVAVGSLYALIFYWAGIFIWIGFGAPLSFGNLWQLYINTAVAVFLTFTSMFLQNARDRHMKYLERCTKEIMKADCDLELHLRRLTGDMTPNPTIEIVPETVVGTERVIDYYAAVIGSGIGVIVSCAVFALWIAIGNSMDWNSNWWLIIGTYTGLAGFIDGFVLRNVYYRERRFLDAQIENIAVEDASLQTAMGVRQGLDHDLPEQFTASPVRSCQYRISEAVGKACSHPRSFLAAMALVVALLCVASGLEWSEKGQLLCNTPFMIIEGFLLLVLIEAHNMSSTQRRVQFRAILLRRLACVSSLKQLECLAKPQLCSCGKLKS